MTRALPEDRICIFLLNSLEHYTDDARSVAHLGEAIGDPARAATILAAWRNVDPTDPVWMKLRMPEFGDRTLRLWIRAIPTPGK